MSMIQVCKNAMKGDVEQFDIANTGFKETMQPPKSERRSVFDKSRMMLDASYVVDGHQIRQVVYQQILAYRPL